MTTQADFIRSCDEWLKKDGPMHHSVVSSRARIARNLEHIPFAPRARKEQLRAVVERIDEAIAAAPFFSEFRRLSIGDLHSLYRGYLKESHLLSSELEQGGEHRIIYISPDYRISIMINEEDHLRIQCLDVGCQINKVQAILNEVEKELSKALHFAHSDRFGYLTACPTNVGTGLRLSVMLHLPGLVLINKIDEVVQSILQYGLTVRGIYGEHSENLGDYFQVSNEVTLGKTPEELFNMIQRMTEKVIEREVEARDALFEQKPMIAKDMLNRALATLKNSWIMDSAEALAHLSKIRLGINRGHFHPLNHADLSRLMIEVQPNHLQCRKGTQLPEEQRDTMRAEMLHQRLKDVSYN